jgi:hypothetical protein
MNPELPGGGGHRRDHEDRQSTQQAGQPLSVAQILAQLQQLNGLIMLGLVTPAQANAISRNLTASLNHLSHREKQSKQASVPSEADIANLWQKDPALFTMMEPFLSQQQIDAILRHRDDGASGTESK